AITAEADPATRVDAYLESTSEGGREKGRRQTDRRGRGGGHRHGRAPYTRTMRDTTDTIPVRDCHNDLPIALRDRAGYDVSGRDRQREEVHTDLVRLRRGGVGAQFWSAWVPSSIPQEDAVVATLQQIDAIHRLTEAYPQILQPARTADGVEAAFASG